MNEELRAMIALLVELKEIQQALLDLAHEKKQRITKSDLEGLNALVKQELELLSKLGAVEKKRAPLAASLAAALKVPEAELTVSFLADHAPAQEGDQLRALQKELSSLLKMQTEFNKMNRELLELQLEYTDAMLNAVVGAEDPLNNFYGEDGRSEEGPRRQGAGLFDQQI